MTGREPAVGGGTAGRKDEREKGTSHTHSKSSGRHSQWERVLIHLPLPPLARHRPLSRHKSIVVSSRAAAAATGTKLECTWHGVAPPISLSLTPPPRRRRQNVTMSGSALLTQFIFLDGERERHSLF